MPNPIPRLALSHGQAIWVLARGEPPPAALLDQFNYIRQLGVPFTEKELGGGRGNPVRYRFDHLAEVGLVLFGLRRGFRPKEIVDLVVQNRKDLRVMYRRAFEEQPASVLTQKWVKSRGAVAPSLRKEIFLKLHDRFSLKAGQIEWHRGGPNIEMGVAEKHALMDGDFVRTLLPLTRMVVELVAWALEAPEIKAGRK